MDKDEEIEIDPSTFTNIHVDILKRIQIECEATKTKLEKYEKKVQEQKDLIEQKKKEVDFKNIKNFYQHDHKNSKLSEFIAQLELGNPKSFLLEQNFFLKSKIFLF